ncbi:MAG: hypothetical protein DCF25_06770 [Leptolyngbya foveolarum]|uniref:Lipoprotein n=1 Tax=Leptolyngbya foveolarum TaxID=47253 RepID=A0A2W4UM74_9CYAN|nr:MAG: hypothetical protein DCF25_06770 [Leptolyngbya foveolarum]
MVKGSQPKILKTKRSIPKKIGLFLGSALLFGLASCSNTVSQCGQFANVINQSQDIKKVFESEIESAKIKASGAKDLAELKTSAQEYTAAVGTVTSQIDGMAQELSGLTLADEQLDEYRDSHVVIISQYKAALLSASEAMQLVIDAKDENAFRGIFDDFQTKANSAFSDIQALNEQESGLIEQVNTYCGQEADS